MARKSLPKPKPVMPILWGICSLAYTALAVVFFVIGESVDGWICAACSAVWWAYTFQRISRILDGAR